MNKDNQPVYLTDKYGVKTFYLNNLLHREDGPAIEYPNGSKYWFLHGRRHRIDGPAIEYYNGTKFWYYHGEQIICFSQEEFERLIKLKALW